MERERRTRTVHETYKNAAILNDNGGFALFFTLSLPLRWCTLWGTPCYNFFLFLYVLRFASVLHSILYNVALFFPIFFPSFVVVVLFTISTLCFSLACAHDHASPHVPPQRNSHRCIFTRACKLSSVHRTRARADRGSL